MSESEWLVETDADTLLKKSRFRNYRRKCRLFAVACCHCIWTHFVDDRSSCAVEVAERHADGLASDEELQLAALDAHEAHTATLAALGKVGSSIEWGAAYAADSNPIHAANTVIWMVRWPRLQQVPLRPVFGSVPDLVPCILERRTGPLARLRGRWKITKVREPLPTGADHPTQCRLIRDIFGNPFRPVTFDVEWRSSTAVALAKQIYASRDFSTMPILADALQDAGCENGDILKHCRKPGTHVRGCWVVDGILGQS